MITFYYHTDKNCRKGCHPVSELKTYRNKKYLRHRFSIDEPGAWFDDEWNCHVDGTDHPCGSKEEAIAIAANYFCYGQYQVVDTEIPMNGTEIPLM